MIVLRASLKHQGRVQAQQNVQRTALRELVPLKDVSDCLRDAYQDVKQYAHQRYLSRGGNSGSALEDWVSAECEILAPLAADFKIDGSYVRVLTSMAGFRVEQVSVGIETNWLLLRAFRREGCVWSHPIGSDGAFNRNVPMRAGILHDCQGDLRHASLEKEPSCASPSSAQTGSLGLFALFKLAIKVDWTRSIAVLCNGVLGIRMAKRHRPSRGY